MKRKKVLSSVLWKCFLITIFSLLMGACSGGGGGGDNPAPRSSEEEFGTGNQGFTLQDGEKADPLNGFRIEAGENNTLPSSIDHSAQMPEVRSQGTTSSCTSWAVGYYGKTFQEVQEEGWDPDQNAFSPSYLYAMQCRTYDNPWGIDKAWEILNRNGIAKWGTLPFEDLSEAGNAQAEKNNYANLTIPQAAQEEAKIFRCGEMARMSNLAQLKEALTKGPVVLAINQYASPPRNPSPEENYMRYDPDNSNAGHAILCVGYDDQKFGTGALKFINSWGSGWGENGFSWILYDDISRIIFFAMNYKDIPNPNTPDDSDSRPDAPSDVQASDDAGSFVDITWSRVAGAQYYRIYRAETDDPNTYEAIGIAYQGNYRDYPSPGVAFFYSVVAVNDLGESDHFASDTDAAGHVDIGSAIGEVLSTPELQWQFNDSDGSHFTVSNIDPAANTMEVLVSTASQGPWDSLGWIQPDDFSIKWGEDSEYTNKSPFVRVRVANADAASDLCQPVQVGEDIDNDVVVGRITVYVVTPQSNSILLRWMTDGGNVDFFEIWRYCASNDTADDWVKIGYSDPTVMDADNFYYYEDLSPLPGVPYYYVVIPVYHGTYGQMSYSDKAFRIEDSGANLHLTSFKYYYSQITTPTAFPDIVVRNDGATRVDSYTVGILAYDWIEQRQYLVAEVTRDEPLEAGYQHTFSINNIDIPNEFANGHLYSWGLKIDYAEEINETYEDDNLLWSNDGWQLATSASAAGAESADVAQKGPRLGSTRPFSHNQPIERSLSSMSAGDEPLTTYNGPSIFRRPDFCNDHRK